MFKYKISTKINFSTSTVLWYIFISLAFMCVTYFIFKWSFAQVLFNFILMWTLWAIIDLVKNLKINKNA